MKSRNRRRASAGDVAVVKLFENESHAGQPFSGELYVVAIVDQVRFDGTVLRFFTGAGYIESDSPRLRDYWVEAATAYDIDKLVDRLKTDHPGGFLRLGELRFFLEGYRARDGPEPRPRRRPDPPPPEARSRWKELGLVSIDTAKQLRDLGFPRFPRRGYHWCLRSHADGNPSWKLQKSRARCLESAPAFDAIDLLEWIPGEITVAGDVYELELSRSGESIDAWYPGLRFERGETVADACGKLIVWLVGEGIVSARKRTE